MIEYYGFYIDTTLLGVYRMRDGNPEKWKNGEWVIYPPLCSVSGCGGYPAYDDISENEALAFIETHSEST